MYKIYVSIYRSSTPVQDERGEEQEEEQEPGILTSTPQAQDGSSQDTPATPVLAIPVLASPAVATPAASDLSSKSPKPLMNLDLKRGPPLPPPVPLMMVPVKGSLANGGSNEQEAGGRAGGRQGGGPSGLGRRLFRPRYAPY